MLEYIKAFFPHLSERIKKSSSFSKIFFILFLLLLPILLSFGVNNLSGIDKLLSSYIKINGYQLLFILASISILLVFSILFLKISQKKLLKTFVVEWLAFKKNFDLLFSFVDVWLFRTAKGNEDEELWKRIVYHLEQYWPARDSLRKVLFKLGETKLMVYDNKHWSQLKNEDELFKERNYEGPFSLLLDLSAPVGEINHHKKAINWSLKISEEFIEHLCYKYSYLEKYLTN